MSVMPHVTPGNRDAIVACNLEGAQAFVDGRMEEAAALYERAIVALEPALDDLAPALYENVGLAYLNLGRVAAAVRCFLRALDGKPGSRQQSAYYLPDALWQLGLESETLRSIESYEMHHGPYDDGCVRAGVGLPPLLSE